MRILLIMVAGLFATTVHAAVSDWLEFENRGGRLTIPVEVGGEPAIAIIDASIKANGMALSGVTGEQSVSLGLSGMTVVLDKVVEMPLVDGDVLIGSEFFREFLMQVDYPNQRIRFLDRESADIKKTANVKMKRMSGSRYPVVRVGVNGEDQPWLAFDIGSTSELSIDRGKAEKKKWLGSFAAHENAASFGSRDAVYVPELSIGPYSLENVVMTVPPEGFDVDGQRILADGRNTGSRLTGKRTRAPDGNLGLEVLKRFVLTIDYKRSLLFIEEPVEAGSTSPAATH